MATQVKHRRGTNAEVVAGTPAIGELWFNITDNSIHMGDGITVGGIKHLNVNNVSEYITDYADLTYKSTSGNTAIDNLIAGAPIAAKAGNTCSTGDTQWLVQDTAGYTYGFLTLDSGLGAFPIGAVSVDDGVEKGVIGTELDDQLSAIERLRDLRVDLKFGTGVYWLSTPLDIDIGTSTGGFWENSGWGQRIICNRTTFAAKTGFTGDYLVGLLAPDASIEGWVNFQCLGRCDYGATMEGANSIIHGPVRVYGYSRSGVYINGRYGQKITGITGGAYESGSRAVVECNDNTGVRIESPQAYRAPTDHYLCYMTSSHDFTIIGGSPDKCDDGVYISQCSGDIIGINFESTKRPIELDRASLCVSGRVQAAGGRALSPENAVAGPSLNIGDAASRRAGTTLAECGSGKLRFNMWGSDWDFENDFRFIDISGPDSTEFYYGTTLIRARQLQNMVLANTTKADCDGGTKVVYTNSGNITVRGAGSGFNNIDPDTLTYQNGFNVDKSTIWFKPIVAGHYRITLTCKAFPSGSPASSIEFRFWRENPLTVMFESEEFDMASGKNINLSFERFVTPTDGLRVDALTENIATEATLANVTIEFTKI